MADEDQNPWALRLRSGYVQQYMTLLVFQMHGTRNGMNLIPWKREAWKEWH